MDDDKPYPTNLRFPDKHSQQPHHVTSMTPHSQAQTLVEDYSSFNIVKATQYGVYDRCVELIESGYDVNLPDHENVSLLHWASINNRSELVK